MFGGIEAGGTKFVCGVGTGPDDVETISFPTTAPDQCVGQALRFFRDKAGSRLAALGIASFGPIDLDKSSTTYGYITTTPKIAWRNFDFAGTMGKALSVPVVFDTDVTAAVLAEARWGAARDAEDCVYMTVGTGIGAGAIVNGSALHGLMHPEIGHIRIPHDWKEDGFAGSCTFHGDCLEGLASGPAMLERWGTPPERLPATHPAWKLEARYLALALSTVIYALSPERIVLGGGVVQQTALLPVVRRELVQFLNGYIHKPQLEQAIDEYLVPPQLGSQSGVLGAILMASEQTRP
jgi:fructokinase